MISPWPARVTCVLFDLDGTLIDSAPGVTACLAATIAAFGGPALKPSSLTSFIGPPVLDTLRALTDVSAARLADAVEYYRRLCLREGIGQSSVFPGVRDLLDKLRSHGVPLAVATSKRETHARAMLELHELHTAFAVISGGAEDESGSDKKTVIAAAMSRLAEGGSDSSLPVMIGDRSFDVRGAAAAGIPAIFAGWGYGAPGEGEDAHATATDPGQAWEMLRRSLISVPGQVGISR
jgi:phosphoglycolate phosphatase